MQIINPIWFEGEGRGGVGEEGVRVGGQAWRDGETAGNVTVKSCFELRPTSHGPRECVGHTAVVWKCQEVTSRTGSAGEGQKQNKKKKVGGGGGGGVTTNTEK